MTAYPKPATGTVVTTRSTPALVQVADRVMEATSLVAVVALPLYFSVLTQTGYEADKALLVRTLAVIAAGALTITLFHRRTPGIRDAHSRLLLILVVLFFMTYGLSTLLSIDINVSFWGSHVRQEGLWTRAAYVILFLVIATRLHSIEQRRRLISVLLLGSVPVVVYGLSQQFGYDPVPTSGDPATLYWPVRSSMGQHVFLGSYLVMLLPFTSMRLVETWLRPVDHQAIPLSWRTLLLAALLIGFVVVSYFWFMATGVSHPALFALLPGVLAGFTATALPYLSGNWDHRRRLAALGAYGILLVMQLAVLVFTGARGAWLGYLAGVPVFGIMLAWRLKRPRISQSLVAMSLAAGLFLVLLNIPGGPLQSLRGVHALNRLANITESGGAGGSAQGRLFIWQGVSTLMQDTPSVGGTWGGPLRDLVGYGPESMHWAFEAVFPLKLRQVTSEIWTWDRAHNIFLDTLVDAGLLGLLLLLAQIAAFTWMVVRQLRTSDTSTAFLLIPAAAAVAGHLMDGMFGLETAVTFFLLYLCLALPVQSHRSEDGLLDAEQPGRPMYSPIVGFWIVMGFAALLCILTPLADNYTAMGLIWLTTLVAGVAVTSLSIPCAVGTQPAVETAHSLSRPWLIVVSVLIAVALGSQAHTEIAATAERSGLGELAQNMPQAAIGSLQQAVRANGYDPQYETELGGAYLTLAASHTDSSDPSFNPAPSDARSIDPEKAYNLGQTQLLQLALYSLQAARSLAPLNPDTHANLGNLYMQWNRSAQALGEYTRAWQLSHDNPRYLDQQALTLLKLGKTDEAARRAHTGLRLDPTFWYTYFTLARIEHASGDAVSAKADASRSLVWIRNYWPPPGPQDVSELQQLAQQG